MIEPKTPSRKSPSQICREALECGGSTPLWRVARVGGTNGVILSPAKHRSLKIVARISRVQITNNRRARATRLDCVRLAAAFRRVRTVKLPLSQISSLRRHHLAPCKSLHPPDIHLEKRRQAARSPNAPAPLRTPPKFDAHPSAPISSFPLRSSPSSSESLRLNPPSRTSARAPHPQSHPRAVSSHRTPDCPTRLTLFSISPFRAFPCLPWTQIPNS
jgi:hypothetical protein